ncbi:MAG: hypothetical protein ABR600_04075 [Actinomycetota bacterium]
MRREGDQPQPGDDPFVEHHRELQRARQTRVAKLFFVLFLVIVFILFIIQNSKPTKIDYVFFHRETKLIWIMLSCGILGGIVGYLVGRPGKQIRLRKHAAQPDKKPQS